MNRRLVRSLIAMIGIAASACGAPAKDAPATSRAASATVALADSAAPSAFGPDTGVLFEATITSGKDLELMPIALVLNDSLIAPPQFGADNSKDPFVTRLLARNTIYDLFDGGTRSGRVRIGSSAYTGCSAYTARALPMGDAKPPFDGLAGRLTKSGGASHRRELSVTERAVFDSLILTVLRENNIPVTRPRASTPWPGFAFTVDGTGRLAIVGNYDYELSPADSNHTFSVSLVAEWRDQGWEVTWKLFREGHEIDDRSAGATPLDAIDINGDGTMELVMITFGYESRSYLVLRRSASGWKTWYWGGGDGC